MEFKIEKNVPLPKEGHHKYLDKFWNEMEIGDSILLPLGEVKNLRQAIRLCFKEQSYGLYKTQKEGDLYRLWKIKERGRKDERKLTAGTVRTYQFRKPDFRNSEFGLVRSNGKSSS